MTWIERLLSKFFPHIDICGADGSVYLRRWFLCPRRPQDNKFTPQLYLHKFIRGDQDRHLHDHPWPFRSLILKGGYFEHSFNPHWQQWRNAKRRSAQMPEPLLRKWYGPGSFIRRGAKWAHKIELKNGQPCWTLFLTGPKERNWGFHTEAGWCWHRHYENGVCWCYDTPGKENL